MSYTVENFNQDRLDARHIAEGAYAICGDGVDGVTTAITAAKTSLFEATMKVAALPVNELIEGEAAALVAKAMGIFDVLENLAGRALSIEGEISVPPLGVDLEDLPPID